MVHGFLRPVGGDEPGGGAVPHAVGAQVAGERGAQRSPPALAIDRTRMDADLKDAAATLTERGFSVTTHLQDG